MAGIEPHHPTSSILVPMIPGKIAGVPAVSGTGLQVNPGGQTVYDPVSNVTWLANANVAATNTFGLPQCKAPGTPQLCVSANGAMNFNSADQFVKNMNAAAYLGQSNWQIPPVDPSCASSYLCSATTAPFQSLYYTQLGLTPGTPVVNAPDVTVGPFTNIRPYLYWTCEASTVQQPCQTAGPAPGFEWTFWFSNGFEGTDVLAHDISPVTAYFLPATPAWDLGPGYFDVRATANSDRGRRSTPRRPRRPREALRRIPGWSRRGRLPSGLALTPEWHDLPALPRR